MRDLYAKYDPQYLPKMAERSAADVRSMFNKIILPALGAKKVEDVTYFDCERLHQDISADRPIRANRVHEVLRRSLNLAIKWGWIDQNPAARIERNPEQGRTRYLSQEEIERLMVALSEHPQRTSCDAITFMLLTGCRRGEALGARWDQFDPTLRLWTKPAATTKQRKEHRVPVSSRVTEMLAERRNVQSALPDDDPNRHAPFVFASVNGNALTDVKRTWAAVTKAADLLDVRLHDLRHTFASLLVSQGQSLPVVGAMLGHTQTQTTQRYAHLYDDALHNAAELVSLSLQNGKSETNRDNERQA